MEFCDVCENMLYIRGDGAKIFHKCNCCQKEFDIFQSKTTCVSKKVLNKSDSAQIPYINPYVFSDPTLPIISIIPCTNVNCTKPPDADNKVVYIRYDTPNMKYIYNCKHCNHTWGLKV